MAENMQQPDTTQTTPRRSGTGMRLLWGCGTALLVALVCAVALVFWLVRSAKQSEISIAVDRRINVTPEQIAGIKAIGEWEFLSVSDEELVDTVRRGIFTDDHLVRIYYGTVRIGINMHQVEPGWIDTRGDTVVVTLPPVDLLDRDFIDEARTRSFHESGSWSHADREALYRRAYQQMSDHCLTPQNRQTARENGEVQFRRMMKSLGFQHVVIHWRP